MAIHFEGMNPPEVSKVSKGVKRGYDTSGVKSVTPFRGTLTPDTSFDSREVSEGFDTSSHRFTLTLRPEPRNWQTPPVQRLRLALKILLRGFGLRAVACRPLASADESAPRNPP
jgi:hypothetical protein